jgi:hypothetical protein
MLTIQNQNYHHPSNAQTGDHCRAPCGTLIPLQKPVVAQLTIPTPSQSTSSDDATQTNALGLHALRCLRPK